jgi:hypothetical protein
MPQLDVPGFKEYNSTSNPRGSNPIDVLDSLNMIWRSNRLVTRDGSSLFKSDAQANWGRIDRIFQFKKLGDNFFYVVYVMTSGRIFYIRSDNVNYGSSTATYTQINNPSSTTPALAGGALKYDIFSFNNKLFL